MGRNRCSLGKQSADSRQATQHDGATRAPSFGDSFRFFGTHRRAHHSGPDVCRGSINGSRPLEVVLDSGASVSIVTPQLAEELHLKTGETTAAAGPGKGGDTLLHIIPNATLKLGGTTLTEQTIAALPIDYVAQQVGVPTEGFFGGNFFTRLVVDEDYATQT